LLSFIEREYINKLILRPALAPLHTFQLRYVCRWVFASTSVDMAAGGCHRKKGRARGILNTINMQTKVKNS